MGPKGKREMVLGCSKTAGVKETAKFKEETGKF